MKVPLYNIFLRRHLRIKACSSKFTFLFLHLLPFAFKFVIMMVLELLGEHAEEAVYSSYSHNVTKALVKIFQMRIIFLAERTSVISKELGLNAAIAKVSHALRT